MSGKTTRDLKPSPIVVWAQQSQPCLEMCKRLAVALASKGHPVHLVGAVRDLEVHAQLATKEAASEETLCAAPARGLGPRCGGYAPGINSPAFPPLPPAQEHHRDRGCVPASGVISALLRGSGAGSPRDPSQGAGRSEAAVRLTRLMPPPRSPRRRA